MRTKRPPAPIRREVRQRAGFGCVMCGSPVFEYEHIYGYSKTRDDPAGLTLLCKFHHGEKTAGRLPVSVVEAANAAPRNLSHPYSAAHPHYFELPMSFELGSILLEGQTGSDQPFGVSVDGDFLVGAGAGNPLQLDLDIRDPDDAVMLLVRDGEIRIANSLWDVTFEARTLTIRDAHRSIKLVLELRAPHEITIRRADVWLHHVHFLIGEAAPGGGMYLPGGENLFSSFIVKGGVLAIGEGAPGFAMFHLDLLRGYGAPPVPLRSSFRRPPA